MIHATVFLACLAFGQSTDDTALKSQVQKLVKQLDADRAAQRDAAEASLVQLGPAGLAFLPEQTADLPPGVRERLARIRQKLQQTGSDAATGASLVTLHVQKMPVGKVLAALGQQTGNKVVDPRAPEGSSAGPEVTVDFDKTPFWTALDTVLDQARLSVYPFGQADALQLVPRGPRQLPRAALAALSGPFRVEPIRIVASRDLRSSGSSTLALTIEIAWEPRLHPIGLRQPLGAIRAEGEGDVRIRVEDPDAVTEAFPRRDASATTLDIPLAMPDADVKQIRSLHGTLRAILPGKIETFSFGDLLHAKKLEKRIAAATVTLDEVRRNGDNWEVYLRMRLDDAGDALESHRNWALANEAYLEGPDGKPIPFDSLETTQRTSNEIGLGYVFGIDKPPEGLKFVYKTPGSIVTKDFPYDLRGIKMP